jgi:hypothetical protein
MALTGPALALQAWGLFQMSDLVPPYSQWCWGSEDPISVAASCPVLQHVVLCGGTARSFDVSCLLQLPPCVERERVDALTGPGLTQARPGLRCVVLRWRFH